VRRVPRERHVGAQPVRRLRRGRTGGQVLPFVRRVWPVPAAVVPSVLTLKQGGIDRHVAEDEVVRVTLQDRDGTVLSEGYVT
jgi:hypothetical protein